MSDYYSHDVDTAAVLAGYGADAGRDRDRPTAAEIADLNREAEDARRLHRLQHANDPINTDPDKDRPF
jgi:hypothetical protein